MKYNCHCEWLKTWEHMEPTKAKRNKIEDIKHHAYLEGQNLPTVEELTQAISDSFMAPDISEADAKWRKNISEHIARAILTYLEKRHGKTT